jgi:hypothetical protein
LAILLVGFVRLALSLGGSANAEARWFSMNAVLFAGMIYLSIRIHTTGFGGYRQLFPAIVIPNAAMHTVAMVAILIGIATGQDNVFTSPEFAFGSDGKTWGHLAAHLLVGTTVGALVNWLLGCLVLFVTKRVVKR